MICASQESLIRALVRSELERCAGSEVNVTSLECRFGANEAKSGFHEV
jgi:hypothetical protein